MRISISQSATNKAREKITEEKWHTINVLQPDHW